MHSRSRAEPQQSTSCCENAEKISADDTTGPPVVTKDKGRHREVLQPMKVKKSSINRKVSSRKNYKLKAELEKNLYVYMSRIDAINVHR